MQHGSNVHSSADGTSMACSWGHWVFSHDWGLALFILVLFLESFFFLKRVSGTVKILCYNKRQPFWLRREKNITRLMPLALLGTGWKFSHPVRASFRLGQYNAFFFLLAPFSYWKIKIICYNIVQNKKNGIQQLWSCKNNQLLWSVREYGIEGGKRRSAPGCYSVRRRVTICLSVQKDARIHNTVHKCWQFC